MNHDNEFEQMLEEHITRVQRTLVKASDELLKRAKEHDQDKLQNPIVYKTYKEHFPILKQIPFGTYKYKQYELTNFEDAHQIHAQNRHHFYSSRNKDIKPNIFDILEAIIDISESSKQYGKGEYKQSLKNKGIYDYSLEDIIDQTLEMLDK